MKPWNPGKLLREERGHTLVETIVALALFVSALLPLLVIAGTMMLDSSAQHMRKSLQIAEEEMANVLVHHEFASTTIHSGTYIIERMVQRGAPLMEVSVSVASAKKPERTILTLRKTFLVHE
jgi:hypothetical protein